MSDGTWATAPVYPPLNSHRAMARTADDQDVPAVVVISGEFLRTWVLVDGEWRRLRKDDTFVCWA